MHNTAPTAGTLASMKFTEAGLRATGLSGFIPFRDFGGHVDVGLDRSEVYAVLRPFKADLTYAGQRWFPIQGK